MSRQRTHQPFDISFGREKSGEAPWTLALELSRETRRGRERVRHVFSQVDLDRLRLALKWLDFDNEGIDLTKKTVNPEG